MKSACLLVLLCGTAAAQPGADYPPPQPPPEPTPAPYGPAPAPYDPAATQPYAPPAYAPPVGAGYAQPSGGSRATFVSTTDTRWDVRVDQNAVCTTPCSLYLEPGRFVTMHSQDRHPQKLSVGYIPPGDFVVNAKPRSDAVFATAVTFTTFSGLAVVTGITLTALGCSSDRSTTCRAGIITGVAGGLGLLTFIPMITRSLPKATIGPATGQPYMNGQTAGLAGHF